jgi:two-component sensor histidine kinase/ligand-binding sensor domain-containing protein
MWFATAGGGVCRFDGLEFVQYEEKDGLAGQIVTGIAEDGKGNLWFTSTWGGISEFDGKKFTVYTDVKNGLSTHSFNSVVYDKITNTLLFGTVSGLVIYDFKEFVEVNTIDGVDDLDVLSFHQLDDGRMIMATDKGAFVGLNNKFTLITESNGNIVRGISSDSSRIWLACEEALILLNKKDLSSSPLPFFLDKSDYIKNAGFRNVHCAPGGQVWIDSYNKGLSLLRKDGLVLFADHAGIGEVMVLSMFTDRTDRTWFGTSGAGVMRFNGFAFTYYDEFRGLDQNDIFGICKDKNGNFWFTSTTTGVYRYDGKEVKQFTTADGLPTNGVRTLICDRSGNIWFGTKEGLVKYDGNRFLTYTAKDGLPEINIRSLLEGKDGTIWVGTSGGGLSNFDGKIFKNYGTEAGLDHGFVHSLHEDSKGVLWIGTGIGLYSLDEGVFTLYDGKYGLCNTYIGNIVEDKFGNIWVGTDKCVAKFEGKKFTTYDVSDGLTSSTVYLMIFDDEGNLIVGTNKGFDKIQFSSYGQITEIKNYAFSEGFTGIECNSRSVYKDQEGSIWFGTVKGIIRYKPQEEIENIHAPKVHILSVKLFYDDKWMQKSKQQELDWFGIPTSAVFRHDQNSISFSVNGICTLFPDKLLYSYKLEGFEEEWSPVTDNPSVSYSNLPPGDYVFNVKARGENGEWSITPAKFSFNIRPAFWQTWWFYVLLLTIVIYVVYYINMLMQQNVMRYNELLEEKVTSRTNEILKQKEEKEVLLKEIHHRVKNNMQVIVSLLNIHSDYIHDPVSLALLEDSKSRIKSMALIHEKLYESKNFSKVNISEYLDSLVEDLISTYEISTKVRLDKQIEANSFGFDTLIPLGLLLNEIVSNSLKYAFPDRAEGTIIFHLKKEGTKFLLLIGDDGIGMSPDQLTNPRKTLGIDLIMILTEQLNGTIELVEGKGTIYKIRFESIDKKRI